MFAQRQACFCAFCKTRKKVYKHKSLSLFEVCSLGLLSLLITSVIWEHLDHRGLVIFILLLTTAEFFMRLRWRYSTICNNCGFDPVVYVKHPERAAATVQSFLDKRKDNPDFLLKPTINLPIRRVQKPTEEMQFVQAQQQEKTRASKAKAEQVRAESKISLRV